MIDESACSTETLCGVTELSAGGEVASITYDGAVDCTRSPASTWSLNGVSQGALEGVGCRSAGAPPGSAGLVLVGLLVLRRRGSGVPW